MNETHRAKQSTQKVHQRYDGDHDLGPDAPVHWSVEELAYAIDQLITKIDALEEEIETLKAKA